MRSRNEDACLARPDLVAVADGMGGYAGGDVAARLALGAIAGALPQAADAAAAVRLAFHNAHRSIAEVAGRNDRWREMGTTLTAAWLLHGRAVIGHVGDSRAYLIRQGHLRQLTQDHSVAAELMRNGSLTEQEARRHPHRHVLTRALGGAEPPEVDVVEVPLQAGDRLVLCTDGLTAALEGDEIVRVVASASSPIEAAEALVRQATGKQAADNVTAVVAFIEDGDLEQEAPRGA